MILSELVANVAASTLMIACLSYLFREVIARFFWERTAHRRAVELQERELRLDHKLNSIRADLDHMRSSAASSRDTMLRTLESRNVALAARRMSAIEGVWNCLLRYKRIHGGGQMLEILDKVDATSSIQETPQGRDLFKAFVKDLPPKEFVQTEAHSHRPFVSSRAWALFAAYEAISLNYYARMTLLSFGSDRKEALDENLVRKKLIDVFPGLDSSGTRVGRFEFLEQIESEFLNQVQSDLREHRYIDESFEDAARISALSDAIKNDALRAFPR